MPPLVEVLAGVDVVLLLVLVLVNEPVTAAPPFELPLLVLRLVEPPPVGVVVPLELPPVFELELDPVFELELVFDDEELVELPVEPVLLCDVGVAKLVVGTVSSGAPLASLLPSPLPPQAASASPASRAAPPARTGRRRVVCTRCCMAFTGPGRLTGD